MLGDGEIQFDVLARNMCSMRLSYVWSFLHVHTNTRQYASTYDVKQQKEDVSTMFHVGSCVLGLSLAFANDLGQVCSGVWKEGMHTFHLQTYMLPTDVLSTSPLYYVWGARLREICWMDIEARLCAVSV